MNLKSTQGKDYQKYFVQILVLYLLLSFPFIIRNLNTSIYAIGLYVLTSLTVLVSFVSRRPLLISDAANMLRKERWLSLFLILYVAYILILSFVSFAYFDLESLKALALKLQMLFYVMVVFFVLKKSDFEKLCNLYLNLMVILSLLGVLLTVLVYMQLIHPLANIRLDSDSHRDLYLLGFTWPDTWIGDLIGLVRLQSFTDEAGTFAFCLLAAIVLAYYRKQYARLGLYAIALILTFSVGAIVAFLVWAGILILNSKHPVLKSLVILAGVIGVIAMVNKVNDVGETNYLATYLNAKVGSDEERTSGRDRIEAAYTVLESVSNKPYGLGAGAAVKLNRSIAVGWIIPLAQAGILGWFMYLFAFLILIYKAVKVCTQSNMQIKPAGQIIIIFAYAALQRGEMDGTFWHWLWIMYFIKQYEPVAVVNNCLRNSKRTRQRACAAKSSVGINLRAIT